MCYQPRFLWSALLAAGLMLNGSPAWAAGSDSESSSSAGGVQVAKMNPTYPVVLSRGLVGQTGSQQQAKKKKKRVIRITPGKKTDTWVTYPTFFRMGHVAQEVEPVGEVIQGMRHHIAFSPIQFIFAEFEEVEDGGVNVKIGDRFRVVVNNETVRHPKTTFGITDTSEVNSLDFGYNGEFAYSVEFRTDAVGKKFMINGVVEVVDLNSQGRVAKLKIIEGFQAIQVGNWLVPMPREKPEMVKLNHQPQAKDIQGFLVANDRTSSVFSSYGDEVYIDKGAVDNVAVGDHFEVYIVPEREGWFVDDLTPHVIGELVVLSTQEHTATAMVVNQTEPLLPGHKIRSKR
ncbi:MULTISPECIES: hypothetical protein [unclassified Nitrospina]|uniref:hypothetical protein n=1 Tax=unclassified Nitrospina TaxID=2638683 RepID=UPI003F9C11CC